MKPSFIATLAQETAKLDAEKNNSAKNKPRKPKRHLTKFERKQARTARRAAGQNRHEAKKQKRTARLAGLVARPQAGHDKIQWHYK